MSIVDFLTNNLFKGIGGIKPPDEVKRKQFTVAETENYLTVGASNWSSTERDRYTYDREDILEQVLEAWRVNPLARRLVELTTQYVIGNGVVYSCKHEATSKFLNRFWHHPLNRMPMRINELCDELTRTGNLFLLITTDQAGMSYIRAVPASDIDSIDHQPNDIEQPVRFNRKPDALNLDPPPYKAYNPADDDDISPVMLHYAINRPVGAQWGESDLAPQLRWLSRYANWLEDRARLNRYRTSFLYVVKAKFTSEAERLARQQRLNASPPSPGSILVTDESEEWSVINPELDSADANQDGLALKKMISAGAGIPLHFLAEPESATRTTAEAAGGPTFRRFEQRQEFFMWLLKDLLTVVVNRRSMVDRKIPASRDWSRIEKANLEIKVSGPDISARDNSSLSVAAVNAVQAASALYDRNLIDESEFLRLVYRFLGESEDVEDVLIKVKGRKGKKLPAAAPAPAGPTSAASKAEKPDSNDDYSDIS